MLLLPALPPFFFLSACIYHYRVCLDRSCVWSRGIKTPLYILLLSRFPGQVNVLLWFRLIFISSNRFFRCSSLLLALLDSLDRFPSSVTPTSRTGIPPGYLFSGRGFILIWLVGLVCLMCMYVWVMFKGMSFIEKSGKFNSASSKIAKIPPFLGIHRVGGIGTNWGSEIHNT